MKINRVISGKYSEVELEDGKKIFLSVLPDRITISEMFLFIPIRKIWEFIFPFYIRTTNEAWDSSEMILQITLDSIDGTQTLDELKIALDSNTNKALRNYIQEHGEKARDISVDKVGIHAIKKMLDPKDLREFETIVHKYGKVQETVGQEMLTKYPAMVFPESLLPYPKEKIRKALNAGIQYTNDQQMAESIKGSLLFLDNFIDDKEANERNNKLLKNKEWQEAVKKHTETKEK